MNIRKALIYLQEQGDALARARAAVLVEGTLPPPEVVAHLEALQGSAGGWPAGLAAGQPASVADTCAVLFALLDLDLAAQPLAQGGLQFLRAQQEEDGGWPAEAGRLCLSAQVSSLLVAYGRAEEPAATQVLDLLLRHQREGGLFADDPRQTAWYALPLLAVSLGQRSGPAQNILVALSRELGEPGWTAAMFAAMLRSLLVAGYGMETPLARHTWEQLLMRQREDGAWAGAGDEAEAVRATLDVLWCWKRIVQR